jgi:hypothetical protein
MAQKKVVEYDLPAPMCRDIGRLMVKFAYVENYLQGIVYLLVGCDQGTGRLAIREPRAAERLDLILDLIAAQNLTQPDVNFKDLRKALVEVQKMRNLCAHSPWTWADDHKAWALLVAQGQWAEIPKSDRARRNKKLFPEGSLIYRETIPFYIKVIDSISQTLREIQSNLATQLQSSP